MGETRQADGLSDAARGRTARGLAARSALKQFWFDESGATAVEYGLLAALLALALVGVLGGLSGALNGAFGKAKDAIANAGT
jgi:pilus assembly protein Flp/PilA